MADPANTNIYAELLPNLRQVSVAASLPSPTSDGTSAELTDHGAVIRVHHAGSTTSLRLPAKVEDGGAGRLPLSFGQTPAGVKEANWRLPLASSVPRSAHGRETVASGVHGGEAVPWSATDVVAGSEVRCRRCLAVIVVKGKVGVWKDLPSENWAEMMDFWHCHKPDHHHGAINAPNGRGEKAAEESLAARGYGANSAISAQRGVGLVDLMAFSLAEDDCAGLTFSSSSPKDGVQSVEAAPGSQHGQGPPRLQVFCTSCQMQLGYFNFTTSAVTMFKWQLLCEARHPRNPSIQDCLAAALTASTASSGGSKCVLLPMTESKPESQGSVFHLWVLNNNIRYASSGRDGVRSALKVLFRVIDRAEAEKLLENPTEVTQDISLPQGAIDAVGRALTESCMLLPARDRVFKEWRVALLDRWTGQ